MTYPDRLEITPLPFASLPGHVEFLAKKVAVPGSKSITNRALVLTALCVAPGQSCLLQNVLRSEDTEVMIECLRRLGFHVDVDWSKNTARLSRDPTPRDERSGLRGYSLIPAADAELFVANSGTTMRFLAAIVALGNGTFRLDGVPRMRERPIGDLLAALHQLGVDAASEANTGCPPVLIHTTGLRGGLVKINGAVSSQFLSGLLLAAPFAQTATVIEVTGTLVSVPYVQMTLSMLQQFGLHVEHHDFRRFSIPPNQVAVGLQNYVIEPDASAASYFFAAAAIGRFPIVVSGFNHATMQGDLRFVEVLEQMGCTVGPNDEGMFCCRTGALHGVDVDMNDISDTVMTLAAVACFAEGPTTIRNVGHIRHKETDRLAALAAELRKIGARVDEFADGLKITPGPLHGAVIETYNDHRMAMSLALVGLRVPGIVIDNPGCVAKTYPRFFEDLEKLRP